ncbi:MAG: hypothetical protein WA765_00465 [Candidatus Acidiferrum sp.]
MSEDNLLLQSYPPYLAAFFTLDWSRKVGHKEGAMPVLQLLVYLFSAGLLPGQSLCAHPLAHLDILLEAAWR